MRLKQHIFYNVYSQENALIYLKRVQNFYSSFRTKNRETQIKYRFFNYKYVSFKIFSCFYTLF